MKKKLLFSIGAIILIFIVGVTVYKFPNMLTADSGFDSSWSSGGSSYSGGSSWSSSSSWDSGSSYSSGSSSSSSSGSITVFDFFLVVLFLIIISMLSGKEEVDRYLSLNHKEEIDDSEFRKYISIPMQQFKKERFEDYKVIQEAWMNFNYDGLRENLTDGLYNQYEMQLETLKVKNQKNIMKNIKYVDSVINSVTEENSHIIVVITLRVNQIDYLEENGVCVKGKPSLINKMKYEVTFVYNKKENVCPSCGNVINDDTNICKYCRNTVSKNPNNWVMSKKQVKYQGR